MKETFNIYLKSSFRSCWSLQWGVADGSFLVAKWNRLKLTIHQSRQFERREKKEESEVVCPNVVLIVLYSVMLLLQASWADIWGNLKTRRKDTELECSCCTWRASTLRRSGRSPLGRGGGSLCRTQRRFSRKINPIM